MRKIAAVVLTVLSDTRSSVDNQGIGSFRYMHLVSAMNGGSNLPVIVVEGAFSGGGAQVGNSGATSNHLELSNNWTYTH